MHPIQIEVTELVPGQQRVNLTCAGRQFSYPPTDLRAWVLRLAMSLELDDLPEINKRLLLMDERVTKSQVDSLETGRGGKPSGYTPMNKAPRETRQAAVEMVLSGMAVVDVSAETGYATATIHKWVREAKAAG